jgi:phage repressor protein C with HTH and peptisase S24 domain
MDNKFSNIKERILYFAKVQGIGYEKFSESIGMTYGNFKGDNKKRPINSDTLENILTVYPDINAIWLLTGHGQMLTNDISEQSISDLHDSKIIYNKRKTTDAIIEMQEVPFYDGLEATAGLQQLFDSGQPLKALETIKIPNLPRCDGALTVTGDSMYPLLKSGDIVLYKQTNVNNIFYGEMYLLSVRVDDWEEYITVKYVQKSDKGEDYIKLVSQNQHHQPRDIKLEHIATIAMVKASIRFNTMY